MKNRTSNPISVEKYSPASIFWTISLAYYVTHFPFFPLKKGMHPSMFLLNPQFPMVILEDFAESLFCPTKNSHVP
jgi:hypothetical protein